MAQTFMPESRYKLTKIEDPQAIPPIGEIVHVRSQTLIPSGLLVHGENFEAIIPLDELTIYSDEKEKIGKVLLKRTSPITAKVTKITLSGMIVLSRRAAMEEALETIELGSIVSAKILGLYEGTHFLDLGGGISAILPIKEVSNSRIKREDIKERFLGIDSINVKILEESDKLKNKFIVSYKQASVPLSLEVGDVVRGRCANYLPDASGMFVELSPLQSGIVDLGTELRQLLLLGYTYSFRVTRVRPKKGVLCYSLELVE